VSGDGDLPRGRRPGEPSSVHPEEQGRLPKRDAAREADEIGAGGEGRASLRAVTLDFWDTLYDGADLPERRALRQRAIATLFGAYGVELPEQELSRLYVESAREADRWWRDEHRGYTTAERLRWLIERAGGRPRPRCEHIATACGAVDESLLRYPPPLLPGAAEAVRALAARLPLAIVSDTGFASGSAQNALLERDGLLRCFTATVYSMDVGHAKPRPEPFQAAVAALGADAPAQIIHVGDNERTDVGGALSAGLRAIRLDVVRRDGWGATADASMRPKDTAAEFVARSFEELVQYIDKIHRLVVK
jgi:FMN phosphatase YigB (HAD superfamily)